MQYAVHISDLLSIPAWHPIRLILDPFLIEKVVQLNNIEFDAHGVVIAERPDRNWPSAMKVAQMHNLPGRGHKIRIYQSETGRGGWVKAKGDAPAEQ